MFYIIGIIMIGLFYGLIKCKKKQDENPNARKIAIAYRGL